MSFENFTPFRGLTDGDGVDIHGVKGGSGPPLLLLHGHAGTHRIWHRCATPLAAHFTVIAADLRDDGASVGPPGNVPRAVYSKRAMAADQVAVMRHFGFERFLVCAHGRGASVAHRMALDYPAAVERLMLLDSAPTLAMDEHADPAFATTDLDWEHDRADIERGNRISCPLRVLWGAQDATGQFLEPLAQWRQLARDVSGRALPCGHGIPEEAPYELMAEMLSFFEAIDS
jgi:haloacetate dehalogenase